MCVQLRLFFGTPYLVQSEISIGPGWWWVCFTVLSLCSCALDSSVLLTVTFCSVISLPVFASLWQQRCVILFMRAKSFLPTVHIFVFPWVIVLATSASIFRPVDYACFPVARLFPFGMELQTPVPSHVTLPGLCPGLCTIRVQSEKALSSVHRCPFYFLLLLVLS